MKRIALLSRVQNGATWEPNVPAAANGTYAVLHDFPNQNRMLVKMVLPDGTPVTTNTIADISIDEEGRQIDINAEPLTAQQRTAAKSFLSNAGLDVSKWDEDAPVNRAQVLRFILRRVANWRDMPVRELLDGWDVA
jgi:hypothetical protein